MKTKTLVILTLLMTLLFVSTTVMAYKMPTTSRVSSRSREIVVNPGCPFCYMGDLNLDGKVDFGDINPMSYAVGHCFWQFYMRYPHGCYWAGDFNHDHVVDQKDVNLFVAALSG